jgi:hypothetical protein
VGTDAVKQLLTAECAEITRSAQRKSGEFLIGSPIFAVCSAISASVLSFSAVESLAESFFVHNPNLCTTRRLNEKIHLLRATRHRYQIRPVR